MDERTFNVIDVDSCQFFEDSLENDMYIGDVLQTLSAELQKSKENLFIMTSKGILCDSEKLVSEYMINEKAELLLFDRNTPGYFFPEITKKWEEFEEFPEIYSEFISHESLEIKGLEDSTVLGNVRKMYELSLKAKEFYAKYFTLYRYFNLNFDALSTKLKGAKALLKFIEAYFQDICEECKGLGKKLQKIKVKVLNDTDKNCGKLQSIKENVIKQCFNPSFGMKMQKRCLNLIKKLEKMLKNLQVKHLDNLDEELFEKQESYLKLKSGFKAMKGTINKDKIMSESTESILYNHLEVCSEFKLFADDLLTWSISKTPGILNYWNSPGKQTIFEQFSIESSKLEKIIQKLEILSSSLDQKKSSILNYYQKYVEFVHNMTSYLKIILKKRILKISDAINNIENSYRFLIEPEFFIDHQGAITSYLQKSQNFQYNGIIYTLLKALVTEHEFNKRFIECYGKVLPSQIFRKHCSLNSISSIENTLLTLKGPFTNDLDFSTLTEDQIHKFYIDQLAKLSSAYKSEIFEIKSSIFKLSKNIEDLQDSSKSMLKIQENNKNDLINLHEELKILKSESIEKAISLNCSVLNTAFKDFTSNQTTYPQSKFKY